MAIQQISVFVENKPGRLADTTDILRENNIDIRALSIADTTNFGIVRLIVDNPAAAEAALKKAGFTVSITNVIAAGVDDNPGGLNAVLHILLNAHITVEYMYAFISREKREAYVILHVEDDEKASKVLEENGVALLKESEIYSL